MNKEINEQIEAMVKFDEQSYLQTGSVNRARYLEYQAMITLFNEMYPNGYYLVSTPENDPSRPQPAYRCMCTICKDTGKAPQNQVFGSADPTSVIDGRIPFEAAQVAAVKEAFRSIGIMPKYLVGKEEEDYIKKMVKNPAPVNAPAATSNTEAKDVISAATPEKGEQRFRRTKEEIAAGLTPEQAMAKRAEAAKAQQKQESANANTSEVIETKAEEPVTEETKNEVENVEPSAPTENVAEETVKEEPVVEETKAEPIISDEEVVAEKSNPNELTFTSEEEARAVVCHWRNLTNKTMGEIIDEAAKGNNLCDTFIKFCQTQTGDSIWKEYGAEKSAIKYLVGDVE